MQVDISPPSICCGHAGIWLKDEKASDAKAYERSLTHCMRMGSLEKETAMRLFEGMEVKQDSQGFSVRYLTVVPFFQVKKETLRNHRRAACKTSCVQSVHGVQKGGHAHTDVHARTVIIAACSNTA